MAESDRKKGFVMPMTPEERIESEVQRTIEKFKEYRQQTAYKKLLESVQKLAVYGRANDKGLVDCITCGTTYLYRDRAIQGGHFSKRNIKQTCHLLENVFPQCWGCNGPRGKGEPEKFAEYLGPSRLFVLEMLKAGEIPFETAGVFDLEKLVRYLVCEIRPALRFHTKRLKAIEAAAEKEEEKTITHAQTI